MEKTITTISEEEKRKQDERALLDSWHPYIESAMKKLHCMFQKDTKLILTESDLKCWLFYYLQHEVSYPPFAVHTEVTHYADHTETDKKTQKEVTEKKHKFRDLSLLCPWEIKANEDFIKQTGNNKNILSKGFKHNANAIHFELKFVRETGSSNKIEGLKSDIEKLNGYNPTNDNHIRDFVIVCGSRSEDTTVEHFKTAVELMINKITNDSVKERVQFYLFDKKTLKHFSWKDNKLKLNE